MSRFGILGDAVSSTGQGLSRFGERVSDTFTSYSPFASEGSKKQVEQKYQRAEEAIAAKSVKNIDTKVKFVDSCGTGETPVPITDPRLISILEKDPRMFVILDTKRETKGGVPINTLKVAQTVQDKGGKISYVVADVCVKNEVLDKIEKVQGVGSSDADVVERILELTSKLNVKKREVDKIDIQQKAAEVFSEFENYVKRLERGD